MLPIPYVESTIEGAAMNEVGKFAELMWSIGRVGDKSAGVVEAEVWERLPMPSISHPTKG